MIKESTLHLSFKPEGMTPITSFTNRRVISEFALMSLTSSHSSCVLKRALRFTIFVEIFKFDLNN